MSLTRLYLDYNATSPLSNLVRQWLMRGDFLLGNPSSGHTAGQATRKKINHVRSFLYHHFDVIEKDSHLFFHSGATEGVNTFLKPHNTEALFVYSPLDHACVREQVGHYQHSVSLEINKDGSLNVESSIAKIKKIMQEKKISSGILNFTWVHNETGVVWSLEQAVILKEACGLVVHVDAVQAPGKIESWKVDPRLDVYTFSEHKFGALKGIGFSFYSTKLPFVPLLRGGGQQSDHRSGTENAMGVESLELALTDLAQNFNFTQQKKIFTYFEQELMKIILGKAQLLLGENTQRNLNTYFLVFERLTSDIGLALFDQSGLMVSSGAACSSGAAKNHPALEFFGYLGKEKNGLRLSLNPLIEYAECEEVLKMLKKVFEKI